MALHTTNVIVELTKHLHVPVIFAEQSAPKPPYPYVAIKEMNSYVPAASFPAIENKSLPKDIEQVATSQPTTSLSVTAYSKRIGEVAELSLRAHDWFSFEGYRALKEFGLVVASLESVINRDSLIIDDYERKRGFDVTLRFVHRQSRIIEEIKVVKGRVNDDYFEMKRGDME